MQQTCLCLWHAPSLSLDLGCDLSIGPGHWDARTLTAAVSREQRADSSRRFDLIPHNSFIFSRAACQLQCSISSSALAIWDERTLTDAVSRSQRADLLLARAMVALLARRNVSLAASALAMRSEVSPPSDAWGHPESSPLTSKP